MDENDKKFIHHYKEMHKELNDNNDEKMTYHFKELIKVLVQCKDVEDEEKETLKLLLKHCDS